jgi:hypothetical protein
MNPILKKVAIGGVVSSLFFTVVHNTKVRQTYPSVKNLHHFCSYPGPKPTKYHFVSSEIFE